MDKINELAENAKKQFSSLSELPAEEIKAILIQCLRDEPLQNLLELSEAQFDLISSIGPNCVDDHTISSLAVLSQYYSLNKKLYDLMLTHE